jgi:hypothetical protein
LPATLSGEDDDIDPSCSSEAFEGEFNMTSRQRAARMRSSPLYKLLILLFSRVFTVYVMASLMRPYSCMIYDGRVVLSTAPDVTCGNDKSWTRYLTLPLLVYMIVTLVSVGSDDSDDLDNTSGVAQKDDSDSDAVKFSPIYAFEIRTCQFFILAICMGGFNAINTMYALGPILGICVIMIMSPLLKSTSGCSWKPLVPVRCCGAIACLWTTIVCVYRHQVTNGFEMNKVSYTLGGGYIVCIILSIIAYKYTQKTGKY